MRFCWRPLAPCETDFELMWLTVSVGAFAAATLWFALRLPIPQCAFHAITGLPCLTCGATRCALQFFHGHLASAWLFNPLAFVAYLALIIFDLYAATVFLLRMPRLRLTSSAHSRQLFRFSIIALVLANWSYLILAGRV